MSSSQRTAPLAKALNVAGIVFTGAIAGSLAMSSAAPAYASPCDPIGLAMTPQPVLSCSSPDAAPAADGAPPVAGENGPPPLSQLGYLREIWHEFHNGVPPDLLYGPAPTDAPQPPSP